MITDKASTSGQTIEEAKKTIVSTLKDIPDDFKGPLQQRLGEALRAKESRAVSEEHLGAIIKDMTPGDTKTRQSLQAAVKTTLDAVELLPERTQQEFARTKTFSEKVPGKFDGASPRPGYRR